METRALMLVAAVTLGAGGCYSSWTPAPGHSGLDAGTPFDAAVVDSGPSPPFDAGVDAGTIPDAAALDAPPVSPFAGFYEGTYMGSESGEVFLEIRPDGSLTIEIRGPRGVERHEGSIRVDGALNAAGSIGALMVRFTGRFTGEPGSHVGSGEWHIEDSGVMGTWELHQVG